MKPDRGASMMEYAALLMLVFIVAFLSLELFGDAVKSAFENVIAAFDEVSVAGDDTD